MAGSVNVRVIVGAVGLIVFLFLSLAGVIIHQWVLFGVALALAAASITFALVSAEWGRTATDEAPARSKHGETPR